MIGVSPDVIERVRMEYLEMPGLALTCRQARRLFNLDAGVSEDILAQLVEEHFLSQSVSGVFLRCATGRRPVHRSQLGLPAQPGPPACATAERI